MPRRRQRLGPPAPVPVVRPRRLLRRESEPARHEALQEGAPSGHSQLRAGRGLGLVLRRRGRDGAGAARAGERAVGAVHAAETWPPLPLEAWEPTCDTLHLWTQIVGKTRLALAPMQNHWWQVVLYVTARGLGTSPVPFGDRTFEIDFDLLDHRLVVRTSEGRRATLALEPQSVADFYRRYLDLLGSVGVPVQLRHPK